MQPTHLQRGRLDNLHGHDESENIRHPAGHAEAAAAPSVQVPSSMYVWTDDTNDPFTATVSAVSAPQTVTLTATSNGISETYVAAVESIDDIDVAGAECAFVQQQIADRSRDRLPAR